MSNIYTSADQLIGHTPLLELTHIEKAHDLKAKLVAKLDIKSMLLRILQRAAKNACIGDSQGICSKGSITSSTAPHNRAYIF